MLSVSGIRLPYTASPEEVRAAAAKILRVRENDLTSFAIRKRSLDARKKPDLFYEYQVDVGTEQEKRVLKHAPGGRVRKAENVRYHFPKAEKAAIHPVVIGAGPAGLFASLLLSENGCAPLIFERGQKVEERVRTAEAFFAGGPLDPESNLQFGEGGAGTFSDGKLNTQIKDPQGRIRFVLETFVKYGAPADILYDAKPHLGTDVLTGMLVNMRQAIEEAGGRFFFGTRIDEILIRNGKVTGVRAADGSTVHTDTVILACGHSARDTFAMLRDKGVPMVPKSFAAGLRIMHPQEMIDTAQYGRPRDCFLPPASYKLTHRSASGRGVYSFCMCPGGYVVNASSETGALAVNGMSYHDRGGEDANAALIVTVQPSDYEGLSYAGDPLAGTEFQRIAEKKAYSLADGAIPLQTFGSYAGRGISLPGAVRPALRGRGEFAELGGIYPDFIREALIEAVAAFDAKIEGFARADALLAGPETRTSSPVRIVRDESGQSAVRGLFPCGEGAGYAGGIVSAAVDGIRTAECAVCV